MRSPRRHGGRARRIGAAESAMLLARARIGRRLPRRSPRSTSLRPRPAHARAKPRMPREGCASQKQRQTDRGDAAAGRRAGGPQRAARGQARVARPPLRVKDTAADGGRAEAARPAIICKAPSCCATANGGAGRRAERRFDRRLRGFACARGETGPRHRRRTATDGPAAAAKGRPADRRVGPPVGPVADASPDASTPSMTQSSFVSCARSAGASGSVFLSPNNPSSPTCSRGSRTRELLRRGAPPHRKDAVGHGHVDAHQFPEPPARAVCRAAARERARVIAQEDAIMFASIERPQASTMPAALAVADRRRVRGDTRLDIHNRPYDQAQKARGTRPRRSPPAALHPRGASPTCSRGRTRGSATPRSAAASQRRRRPRTRRCPSISNRWHVPFVEL